MAYNTITQAVSRVAYSYSWTLETDGPVVEPDARETPASILKAAWQRIVRLRSRDTEEEEEFDDRERAEPLVTAAQQLQAVVRDAEIGEAPDDRFYGMVSQRCSQLSRTATQLAGAPLRNEELPLLLEKLSAMLASLEADLACAADGERREVHVSKRLGEVADALVLAHLHSTSQVPSEEYACPKCGTDWVDRTVMRLAYAHESDVYLVQCEFCGNSEGAPWGPEATEMLSRWRKSDPE